MHTLTPEDRKTIEQISVFCMQNVKNDSDIAAGYNSIMFAHARKLHEQKFPTSTIKDIVYMTFSLFRLYIAEHEDAEKFQTVSAFRVVFLNAGEFF